MEHKIVIERAKTSDVKGLTLISKRAFDDDSRRFLNRESGGPPGYASEKVNSKLLHRNEYYKVRLEDYTTIGGIIFSPKDATCYIHRIFIDAPYQNQGIGKYVLKYIQNMYPDIEEWVLETPSDNSRTNHFYEKCDYKITHNKNGFNHYKKCKTTI